MPDPGQRRGQVEQRGEQILALDDPGDRLDMQRVDREHGRDGPGAGQGPAPEHPPDQQDVGDVQEVIDGVIAERSPSAGSAIRFLSDISQLPAMTCNGSSRAIGYRLRSAHDAERGDLSESVLRTLSWTR